jgi:branched-chain amino acid transport system substrate-binding protein
MVRGPRRKRLYAAAAVLALLVAGCSSSKSSSSGGSSASGGAASGKTLTIGAVLPITGPYAETGEMQKLGAQIAIDEINASGGIKSLGGAKLKLNVVDAGTAAADTVSAVTSLLSGNDLVAGIGPGISTNAVALAQIIERNKTPWMDFAFVDTLTTSGYKYFFDLSPTQTTLNDAVYPAVQDLAKTAGVDLKRVGSLIAPNPTSVAQVKSITDIYAPKYGWQVVMNETVTAGSLTGGAVSGFVGKMLAAKPQVMLGGSSVPDSIQIQKLQIAQGLTPIPWVLGGAPYGSKSLLDALGASGTQGLMYEGTAGAYPSNKVVSDKIEKAGQIAQEYNLIPYAEIYVIANALETTKSTDHDKIRDAIAATDMKGGPAGSAFPCNCIKFDPSGRTAHADAVIIQWQDGKALTVYPASVAQAKAFFPKS